MITRLTESGKFYEADRDLEAMAHSPRYATWIFDVFGPYLHGDALEIGAGAGTMSARLRPSVATLDLLEPSPQLAAALRARFASDDKVRVINATAEGHFDAAAADAYDTMIMVNVLEHIEDDIGLLTALRPRLRDGGHLLLYVPAMPMLYSKIDRQIGHFRRYTAEMLRISVETAGFRILRMNYMDVLGVAPWYILNTLLGSVRLNSSMVALYDMVGVPVTRAYETAFGAPFGKNLILIADKNRPDFETV